MMKAAAEGHEQPFDEAAWQKMELLLDEDKDRRRPLFWAWWLLPLLIGTGVGGYFIFSQPGSPAGTGPASGSGHRQVESTASADKEIRAKENKLPSSPILSNTFQKPGTAVQNKPRIDRKRNTQLLPVPDKRTTTNTLPSTRQKLLIAGRTNTSMIVKTGDNISVVDSEKQTIPDIGKTSQHLPGNAATPRDDTSQAVETKKAVAAKVTAAGNDTIPALAGNTKHHKKDQAKKASQSRWYVLVAGGAEGSSTRIFSVDKISARAGVAIGYQLNKNLALQTGFFSGSKKYVAGPKDYKAKAGTYWSTVEILEVDANCLVYEIPLDLRYDLRPAKSTNIFTSVGLSSYIMKKEDYDYSYNRYGYPHFAEAYYNGNKHLFSVIRLSAGVERKVSKNLSMFAAPALSIPLAGVGEGQVKLYSAEMMLGVKYQPLKKSKNK